MKHVLVAVALLALGIFVGARWGDKIPVIGA